MKKIVLFGAGYIAHTAIELIGKSDIAFIVDNDSKKSGSNLEGIQVYTFSEKKQDLGKYSIVISVSDKYIEEIEKQLSENGINNYQLLSSVQMDVTKRKIAERPNYLSIYNRAINWIQKNTIDNHAIICNSDRTLGYPEVTGYYIPSLIRWGYRDLAICYASWLLDIQKADGSWYDTDDRVPYIFDSAQILKGLIAVRYIYPDIERVNQAIKKCCDWILSCMTEEGRLMTPFKDAWGDDEGICSEIIHLYCLSPIVEAGKKLNKQEYIEKATKILSYYKINYYEKIMNFSLLSHFYAYVMEALVDLGEIDMAREAMRKMEVYQKESGAVPAFNNVDWVCSTGLFQLALVWYRLGNYECADKAFEYACKLQNATGGWYGSYISEDNPHETNTYFPSSEISWAVKYFLDALYYKNQEQFERLAPSFMDSISMEDDRYLIIEKVLVKNAVLGKKVLDIGCGKGRYLKNLLERFPDNYYYASDLSENVMEFIGLAGVEICQGNLTCIPFEADTFDVVYTCEALEYAIDIKNAIKEMARVTRPGGRIIIIDKNKNAYGRLLIGEWEQWFDINELSELLKLYCSEIQVIDQIGYEGKKSDGLFCAWIGMVK